MREEHTTEVEQMAEVHFLAALMDELMRELLATDALSRSQLNAIEGRAATRAGTLPRPW